MLVVLVIWVVAFGLSNGNITGQKPKAGTCLCFSHNSVRIRTPACGPIIGSANAGQCFRAKGRQQWCTLSGKKYEFHNINFNGKDGWSAGNFLNLAPSSECGGGGTGGNCSGATIVSRSEWGARAPNSTTTMSTPVSKVFIHHTATGACTTLSACVTKTRAVQNYHMNIRGWSDIGYSWLVGEDGRVYEGRGWTRVGAHTYGYNHVAVAVSVIGNFQGRLPNPKALAAIKNIIACGVTKGYIRSNYDLFGHRSAACTACPGNKLWEEIKKWPRFSNSPIRRYNCGG